MATCTADDCFTCDFDFTLSQLEKHALGNQDAQMELGNQEPLALETEDGVTLADFVAGTEQTATRPPGPPAAVPPKKRKKAAANNIKSKKTREEEIRVTPLETQNDEAAKRQVSDNSREIAMEAAQKDAAQKEAAQKEAAQKDAAQKESSQKYRKMSLLEHIRERPDSYVGSVVEETRDVWIFLEEDPDVVRVVRRQISLCPALYKCIDELIVNAIDQAVVDDEVDVLKIEVRDGAVVVSNNGKGIPVVLHDTEKVYVPELVFGHLLTSSNYDDSVERVVGGRNGYGAKLANVFSKEFRIEVADPTRGLRYTQTFRDGMKVTEPPKITSPKNGVKGGVTVRYVPDLYGLSPDLEALIRRRALDACACTPKHVKVFFNGKKMNVKGAEQYVDAYLGPKKEAPRVSEACDRWHVVVAASSEYKAISFVNGVFTGLGGTHVEHVLAPVAKRVADTLATRGRCAVKPSQVRERLALFVFATIVNPTFSSQTKDALTTKASLFGSAFTRHDALAEKIVAKLDIANDILAQARLKESKSLAKSDGTKTANLRGIPNLEDALKAGTSRSNECTLILTEGLSARTFAISGLSVVGRERYGVFPLKGKLLNLRNASVKQQSGNEEFMNIKKILGLKQGVQYDNLKQLRYGKIMVLADADIDGIHIRGLCLNVIDHFWPELLRLGFVCTMRTPIVKAKRGSEVRSFATLREFDEFKASNDVRTWTCKYYKGLGSSTQQEAKEIFRSMEVVDYAQDHLAAESMVLAFDSAKANQRKEWILKATRDPPREPDGNRVSISDFVHKELVHFSVADVKRSIASVMDGLKPTQRKVLYACFKRNLKNDVKVAQLTGYASEVTHYVHGEASLTSTIVNMAQDFCGSGNLNLLEPVGQFGSRLQGGKDAASPRYISTKLSKVAQKVFREEDFALLTRVEDDGQFLEPVTYVPVIPMVLVNGSEGIGTGFSSYVPPHGIIDVIDNLKRVLRGSFPNPMTPWFRGFKGSVEISEDGKSFVTKGEMAIRGTHVKVTELPIGMWTDTFKDLAEANPDVERVVNKSTENEVDFEIRLTREMPEEELWKAFRLAKKFSVGNMHLFDPHGTIHKYVDSLEILNDFLEVRLQYYEKRKDLMEREATRDLEKIEAKLAFVTGVVEGVIPLFKATDEEIKEGAEKAGIRGHLETFVDLPAKTFTAAKIKGLHGERDRAIKRRADILAKSANDMYVEDLEEIEAAI